MPIHSLKDIESKEGASSTVSGERIDGEKLPTDFAGIYHEKQIGSLCAVHALNNLLQAPLLNEVGLAEIAHKLDAQERLALRGTGLEAESANVRADGFFSVQVITQALEHLGLSATPIGASSMRGVAARPEAEVGFIFNRSEHWFSVRRLGTAFFDLNSMQPRPRVLSVAQLSETFAHAAAHGYSVFVVRGAFPSVQIERAPNRLKAAIDACTAAGGAPPGRPIFDAFTGHGQTLSGSAGGGAPAALPSELAALQSTDPELAAALIASMADAAPAVVKRSAEEEAADVRRKRLERFGAK
ncbi:hypothetical protein KFE25_001347 [Diacronema lutheri]|uniref:ubiquitinyl hydrolase 1 n=2 Tax=Diacronema lutheri TaxID=2081491 RepID=A0A8J5XCF6_DIALT|nr:hypothetical protein KFE25_001347 [Diacronema lutheri]